MCILMLNSILQLVDYLQNNQLLERLANQMHPADNYRPTPILYRKILMRSSH